MKWFCDECGGASCTVDDGGYNKRPSWRGCLYDKDGPDGSDADLLPKWREVKEDGQKGRDE